MRKKKLAIYLFCFLLAGFALVISSLNLVIKKTYASLALPEKIVFGYSVLDDNEVNFYQGGGKIVPNVISTTSRDWDFIHSLENKGVIVAAHVGFSPLYTVDDECYYQSPTESEDYCAQKCAEEMTAPLTEGFHAISIDEIGSSEEISFVGKVQIETLKKLKEKINQNYTGSLVFAWGTQKTVANERGGTLRAIRDYADIFIYEKYLPETWDFYFSQFEERAATIEQLAPGLLSKTIFGIGVRQKPDYTFDNDPLIEFKQFINKQFHIIRNGTLSSQTRGIALYNHYNLNPDIKREIAKMAKYYFIDGQTSAYGGNLGFKLSFSPNSFPNPSFETDNGWKLSGNAQILTYDVIESTNGLAENYFTPSNVFRFPHGEKALFMNKTSQDLLDRAYRWVSVKPNTRYSLEFYIHYLNNPQKIAPVSATVIMSQDEELPLKDVFYSRNVVRNVNRSPPPNSFWTRVRIYFTTPEATVHASENYVNIGVVSQDSSASVGDKTVWDFIELEPSFDIPDQIPPTAPKVSININQNPPEITWWDIEEKGGAEIGEIQLESPGYFDRQYADYLYSNWAGFLTSPGRFTAPSIADLPDGEYLVKVRAIDFAGNAGEWGETTFVKAEPINLSPGWNEIVWPDIQGIKASDIPDFCPVAVSKENFWFLPYVKNYGGVDFGLESGEIYYLKCNQDIVWNL